MLELITALLLMFGSTDDLLLSAHEALANQQWENAAETLDTLVSSMDDPLAEIEYDRGIAHYNMGHYAIAIDAFEHAMAKSKDPLLGSYSAYNFGNALYQHVMVELEGTTTAENTKEALIALSDAKDKIKQALDGYRTAIGNDPKDEDSRANGELAWYMLKQLDTFQDQMEEQQKQLDDQSDPKQQNNEGQDKQQQGDEQQDQQSSDQNQDSNQQDREPQQGDGQQDQQSSEQQQNGEQQDQQSTDQEEDTQNDDEQHGKLESSQDEQSKTDQECSDDSDNAKANGQNLSHNEAKRLLQLIRDKEQQRRKMLAARRAKQTPVQKDW